MVTQLIEKEGITSIGLNITLYGNCMQKGNWNEPW
jgi:hypothetical protein